ncbi:acetoacetate--CoA ligase [Streptomyces sp. SID5785]|uniref:acetoacetate--CoA ligase n=1 Tax=Streptomyces sp. SID5785 TaxID=2690309 RepID=UPI001361AC36|nr:acetoacetate--CoA ligase [Streptomyces sp. SID5785]
MTGHPSNIADFQDWLHRERGLDLPDYARLWRWSTGNLPEFWSAVWDYYGLGEVSTYDEVLADAAMPGATWFPGARLNFARQCLTHADDSLPALVAVAETGDPETFTRRRLAAEVAGVAATLRDLGVGPGDCVAGYLPNIPEAVVALLATAAIGATWTVCSPDFGTAGVLDRLRQAGPKVLVAADGYRYAGTAYDCRPRTAELLAGLPTVRHLVRVDRLYAGGEGPDRVPRADVARHSWSAAAAREASLVFADVAFDHPLWILWSSGTTGVPKGIVHGHGGIVVELLKALGLGIGLREEDRFLFHTSTSWMVWNLMVGGLLHGSTLVLYDGSPTHPGADGVWRIAERTGATVVGVGAAYLTAGEKAGSHPARDHGLGAVRSVLQTGSAMPDSTWRWVRERAAPGARLQSICGGTDICSVLAGDSALLPEHTGRLAGPALGVALAAWDAEGRPVVGEQGELVVTAPMPSMPLRFVGDPGHARYRASYFDHYPGVWRHGDWVTVHEDLSVQVAGRSDATLNRMGVRMGSADLYAVVERLPRVADSLVVGAELPDGGYAMPLFVVPAPGERFDDALRDEIVSAIRRQLSPRHVPDVVVPVEAVPRTLTGKKLEVPVKRILQGARVADVVADGTVTRPDLLPWFADFAARSGYGIRATPT